MDKFTFILKSDLEDLPKIAGVYSFWAKNEVVYIGKAINIKDRVKNHFFQPTYKDDLYIQKVEKIGFIETGSEIEALILEARLIKKHQPKFNAVWRDDKNYFYVAIAKNNDKIPYVFITHQPKKVLGSKYNVLSIGRKRIPNTKYNILNTHYIGPFTEGTALKRTLKFLRRIFPYYTSVTHPKNKCTWCHLGLCPGPNPNLTKYKKNIKKLALILQGKRKTAWYALKKEMEVLSKEKNFEEALIIRDKMNALQQVMAHAHVIENNAQSRRNLIMDGRPLLDYENKWGKTEKILQGMLGITTPISKIECYDISNIQGTQAVGSMVVFVNGKPDKSQYKKFRIRMENKPNDIAMLKEVLTRRLAHPEWGYPKIMVIDGGIAELNIGIKSKLQFKDAMNISIISIAKGKRELLMEGPSFAKASAGKAKKIPLKELPQEIYNLIVYLDDEAHRFAITYHKKLRKKALLPSTIDKNTDVE